jgi:murein DD-endopeptidase MepM/ murein hydrolase activator NlpD
MAENEAEKRIESVQETAEGETEAPASPLPAARRERWETALRRAVNTWLLVVIVLLALAAWDKLLAEAETSKTSAQAAVVLAPTPTKIEAAEGQVAVSAIPFRALSSIPQEGIARAISLHTSIPTRPRVDVITYTVQTGDNLFSIADKFGLKPETILWGNFEILEDNPHILRPDQVLNILPTDGTYYQWHEDDTLGQIADFFEVDPQAIIEYPGNRFDLTETSVEVASIDPGAWLIVPGGKRELKDWGPPAISRQNPASAAYYGPGHCGAVYEGAFGVGTFVWPTVERFLSGYGYNPAVHPAIDIAGSTGNAIFATDSGVVVYAGWSNYGYGYLIVIDHGNGWQSAYAHLSAVGVGCGQSVYQGTVIGAMGSTGNSSGPHLHFELVYNGAKVNPLNFLQ